MTANEFNRLSEKLGCIARISGKKKPIFQKLIGYTSDGYELVIKITVDQFSKLISNYPELH